MFSIFACYITNKTFINMTLIFYMCTFRFLRPATADILVLTVVSIFVWFLWNKR